LKVSVEYETSIGIFKMMIVLKW